MKDVQRTQLKCHRHEVKVLNHPEKRQLAPLTHTHTTRLGMPPTVDYNLRARIFVTQLSNEEKKKCFDYCVCLCFQFSVHDLLGERQQTLTMVKEK